MHIDQANIFNLKSLWTKYGSKILNINNNNEKFQQPKMHINSHWPNRCWFNGKFALQDFSWLSSTPDMTIFPIWPMLNDKENTAEMPVKVDLIEQQLQKNNWHCILEQTAMFLAVSGETKGYQVAHRVGFTIKRVKSSQDITLWLDIVQEAFGYSIEREVIEKLIDDPDMQILMAYQDEHAIASALLYKTGNVIGIHQVGVKLDHQGKGVARTFMKEIIKSCHLWQGKHIVLQASSSGKALYEQLGFKSQFLIKSYQRQ